MIVGKVEHPTYTGGGLSFGYDLGSDNMKGNALNSVYKSFTTFSFSGAVGMGMWRNGFGFNAGYGYRYTFYSKDKPDPNDGNISKTVESFKSLSNGPYLSASTNLFRDKRGNVFGLDISYYPYKESRFNSVATLPSKKLFVKGTGYGATLFFSSRFAGCDIAFRSFSYEQDLTETIGSLGCGFGFSLF